MLSLQPEVRLGKYHCLPPIADCELARMAVPQARSECAAHLSQIPKLTLGRRLSQEAWKYVIVHYNTFIDQTSTSDN